MKYLKSYKLFESIDKSKFPTYTELHDFFVELEDDDITKFNYKDDMLYLFFPERWNREIQSQLYFDICFEEDFLNHKPKELAGDSWNDFFMDPITYPNKRFLRDRAEWIHLGDTSEELFVEEIEKGNIKAYPFIRITFDMFDPKYLDEVIDRLKMVYESTDFRPLWGFWLEDYVDLINGEDVETFVNSSLYLVNCSDEEYKNLVQIFDDYNLDKQVTKHFI